MRRSWLNLLKTGAFLAGAAIMLMTNDSSGVTNTGGGGGGVTSTFFAVAATPPPDALASHETEEGSYYLVEGVDTFEVRSCDDLPGAITQASGVVVLTNDLVCPEGTTKVRGRE